jgi:hypothetical protein
MHGKRVCLGAVSVLWPMDKPELGGREMRKIAAVLVIALAWGTVAGASDIAISTQAGWFGQAAADREMQEIVANVKGVSLKVFTANDQAALADWVRDHTGDGGSDLLILCGQFPATIYAPGNTQADDSLAELFLDDGNCIINTGDYMFYVVDGAGTNGEPGLETMMDLAHIAMWDDDTAVTVTADGKQYTPSLQDYAVDRPWHLDELQGDWYAELILAQNAAGTRAEPAIIANRVTGGRLGTFYQTSGQDGDPRGEVISEWINNWYLPKFNAPKVIARAPSPRDGSMADVTSLEASWQAGDLATAHEVYFGTDADQVAAATPADANVFVGRQDSTKLLMGTAGGVVPEGLVPGHSYFWRVDEVKEGDPASPWKGRVWSFTVRPLGAFNPFPPDGAKYLDPNVDLSWEMGQSTIFHTVYFSPSFDEVNDATVSGMMVRQPEYDPGALAPDTQYWWRVDEFAYPANRTTKGPVWSFTTLGTNGGARATYFSGMDVSGDPVLTQVEKSIDHNWGEGEVAGGLADLVSARWTGYLEAPSTGTCDLITSTDDGVRLWFDGRLVINGWRDQGTTDYIAPVDLTAGQVYPIRMEWYENGGGAVARLSWQSPTLAREIIPEGWLQQPLRAVVVAPANGEPHAVQDAVLQWFAGEGATDHDVYFGTDANTVAAADTTTADIYQGRQTVAETSFAPGDLEWGKVFFWRVDEVNADTDTLWRGPVWSFTTADFLIVDDFESYDNVEGTGTRIYETWLDGYSDGSSGSTVGYLDPPFAEQVNVHGGCQSMPLDYNNVNDPFFSEATCEWSTAQNWTVHGVDTLTLHFRGAATNGPERLYVRLTDSTGKTATVAHPDAAAATATEWTEWKIPLSSFTGVSASKIKTMVIGLGNRDNPTPGGAGRLFIDDIWITKP